MEGNIFGSVLDLSALLGDGGVGEGSLGEGGLEGLEDLDDIGDLPRDFPGKASSHDSHLTGVSYDASNDEADNFALGPAPLHIPTNAPHQQVWGTCGNGPAPFKQTSPENAPTTASLLSQLLSVIQGGAPQKSEHAPHQIQQGTVTSQPGLIPSPSSAGGITLPSLTAQQQQTLQTIMSLGSVGSTPEGKKVRRMLSNRESARRSRYRKQAHVHNLEEKVLAVDAENRSLKITLEKANEQELRYAAERSQLQAEIATLRTRISQMEHAGSSGTPVKSLMDVSNASAKAESLSFDSCCASMPCSSQIQKSYKEPSSKKRKVSAKKS